VQCREIQTGGRFGWEAPLKSSPAPEIDRDRALELILRAPIDELEELARRHFSPAALRRRRLARRDEAIRFLAMELIGSGGARTGRKLASIIAKLLRQASPALSPAAPGLRRALEIKLLCSGRCPSADTLRRALAGLAQNQPRQ
jgi:hypothetical protein